MLLSLAPGMQTIFADKDINYAHFLALAHKKARKHIQTHSPSLPPSLSLSTADQPVVPSLASNIA